jgi:hypothetical protein
MRNPSCKLTLFYLADRQIQVSIEKLLSMTEKAESRAQQDTVSYILYNMHIAELMTDTLLHVNVACFKYDMAFYTPNKSGNRITNAT